MRKIRKCFGIVHAQRLNFSQLALAAALAVAFSSVDAQPTQASAACLDAARRCESSTDCVHRLAALQSSCVTNTCQPQCRESAMNLYQNREGRQLLRTDVSCVPGRYELEKCGLLPNRTPKHCSFAKLVCESDLPCNAKWEVFASECELETADGRCSDKCRRHLNATLATQPGASLQSCICTEKDDSRCTQLRDGVLDVCLRTANRTPGQRPHPSSISENDINAGEEDNINEDNTPADDVKESARDVPDSATAPTAIETLFTTVSMLMLLGVARYGVVFI